MENRLFLSFKEFPQNPENKRIAKTPIIKGIHIEIRDIKTDKIFSIVLKIPFPKPPVNFVEPNRNSVVPDWIVPATPPPAKILNPIVALDLRFSEIEWLAKYLPPQMLEWR